MSEIVEIVARLQNGDNGKEDGVESGCDFKGKCELF